MKHPFLWSVTLWALSLIWPIWLSKRTRGMTFIVAGVMPFIAFVAAWWLG